MVATRPGECNRGDAEDAEKDLEVKQRRSPHVSSRLCASAVAFLFRCHKMTFMLIQVIGLVALCGALSIHAAPATQPFDDYSINFDTPTDSDLQKQIESIDAKLRDKLGIKPEETNV